MTSSIITSHIQRKNKRSRCFLWFFSEKRMQCWLKIVTQKCCCSVAVLETLKHKRYGSAFAAQISVKTVSVISVLIASEFFHSLYKKNQSLNIINIDEWIQKEWEFILKLIFFIMKVQTDHSISEMIAIMIEHFSFQMIMIFFTFSEFLDFKKKSIKRELMSSEKIMSFFLLTVLAFSMKNLFLTDLLTFHFLIFSVILMIQTSVSSEILFSDSLKFLFLISAFLNFLNAVLTDLLTSLVDQNMCLCCSKQLIKDSEICCFCFNEYQKCFCCESNKIQYVKMSIFHYLNDSELILLDFWQVSEKAKKCAEVDRWHSHSQFDCSLCSEEDDLLVHLQSEDV